LKIRVEQMQVLEQLGRRNFEQEMVLHSGRFSPRLCEVLGEKQLSVAVRQGIARAEKYGFSKRGPIRLFIELQFIFGSAFDTDLQYPFAAKTLASPDEQMVRAGQLHAETLKYLERVSGPKAANTHKALRELAAIARKPLPFGEGDLVPGMLREMSRVFPEKAAAVGEAGMRALIGEASAEARNYGLPSPRADAVLVTLMYAFGHGCTNDPLYPWIRQTLTDDRITTGAHRSERLEKKAHTWLEHVIADFPQGT
jgi:hypothetical protein